MKYDDGKLDWSLLPIEPIEEIVKILMYGAKKYSANSWQGLENGKERYYSALLRHLVAWHKGEKNDPESGLPHLSHVLCNAVFLSELDKNSLNYIPVAGTANTIMNLKGITLCAMNDVYENQVADYDISEIKRQSDAE